MDSFSEPPPSASHSDPSDIQEQSIGSTHSAASCPYNVCPGCCELEELDRQVMDMHDLPTDLSNRHHTIMRRINGRHDLLTLHLPIELISFIFILIANTANDRRRDIKEKKLAWNPALQLGAVCRRWRDITLSTPQLWTHLIIVPKKHGARPDIAEQWLSRSLAYPLTLYVSSEWKDDDEFLQPSPPPIPYQNIVRLLRPHANRWKDLTLEGPGEMVHMLLNGLEEKPAVDSLDLFLHESSSHTLPEIIMAHPFLPQRLRTRYSPLQNIPIQWDRLTELLAHELNLDAFLHIFRHAHNLHWCFADYIEDDAGHYPIDTSPVTNTSLEGFHTTWEGMHGSFPFYVLAHLSLPSLKRFHCGIKIVWTSRYFIQALEMLTEFLERHPPFEEFHFSHADLTSREDASWFYPLSSITSLYLRVRGDNEGQRVQSYLEGLAHRAGMALPRLRKLEICTDEWNALCWPALAAIFPDYAHGEDEDDDDPGLVSQRRPLETVQISIGLYCVDADTIPVEILSDNIYARLCAIEKTGVKLQVFNSEEIAIFGPQKATRVLAMLRKDMINNNTH